MTVQTPVAVKIVASEDTVSKVKGIEKYLDSRKQVIAKFHAEKEIILNETQLEEFKIDVAKIRDINRAELTKEEFNELVDRFNARSTVAKILRKSPVC